MRRVWRTLVILGVSAAGTRAEGQGETRPRDTVVLIHGLGRTHRSMWALAAAAGRRGYHVVNWRYASTGDSVTGHAVALDRELSASLRAAPGAVHFVTHSLGGIVLRQYLANTPLPNVGRVVMLAPPNQGSEVADQLVDSWIFRRAGGPSGQELTTNPRTGPARLPAAQVEVGVIAGSRAANPLFGRWIGAANDGKVAVERTKLPGMKDFLVVPHGHTFIAWHRDVIEQVFHFLRSGSFERAAPTTGR